MTTFAVSITDTMDGEDIHKLYVGEDFQTALDIAFDARAKKDWRGKWIKFVTPEKVKWARIS